MYEVTGGDVAAVVAQRTVSAGTVGALNASVKSVLIGKVGVGRGQGGRARAMWWVRVEGECEQR